MDRNDYYGGDSASLNLTQVRALYSPLSSPILTPPHSYTASLGPTNRPPRTSVATVTTPSISSPSSLSPQEN